MPTRLSEWLELSYSSSIVLLEHFLVARAPEVPGS